MVDNSICAFPLLVITVRNMCVCAFDFVFLCFGYFALCNPRVLHCHWSERVYYYLQSSPHLQFPLQDLSQPLNTLSLFISLTFPYILLKRHVWLSGNLGPVNSVHNFFFPGSSSTCNWSLDNLLGRKWSHPPLPLIFWNQTSKYKTQFINWNIVLQPLSQVWHIVLPWTVAQRPLCPTPSQIAPQDHVLWIIDAIQTSQTLSLIAPPAFNVF